MTNNTAPAVDQTVEDLILSTPGLILTEAEQVSQEIAGRILGAPSVADVLAPQVTTPAEDVVNVPLTLTGVKWLESTLNQGPKVYAVVSAVSRDGQVLTITTGASTVLAQLYRLVQLDGFPCSVRFVKAEKATKAGYHPMWLEAVDENVDF
jgi:hypothetical protein